MPTPSKTVWAALLVALLALGASTYLIIGQLATVDRASVAEQKAKSLGEQVADACAKGGAAAAELGPHVCEQARDVQQLPGPPGAAGERGPTGPAGPPGRDGRDGTTPPCLSEPPQCHGSEGQPGAQGGPGVPGTAGAAGADGAPGKPGADGKPGRDGTNGTNGQPPAGWTWTDDAGRRQTCTRDEGSPDTGPTYTCTASPPLATVPKLPIGR